MIPERVLDVRGNAINRYAPSNVFISLEARMVRLKSLKMIQSR